MDAIQPRALLRLSDEALDALCRLLMAIELHGEWPEAIRDILIVLLPKSDGGRRPIGLLPTVVRVWMRARGPVVRAWRASLAVNSATEEPQRMMRSETALAQTVETNQTCFNFFTTTSV